jgi:hypothetical protein
MFSGFETIFSKAETVVEVPGTVFPVIETVVSTIKAMVFLVETTVCGTKTLFSEAVPIFYTSETGFSITVKIVGKVPAVFGGHHWNLPTKLTGGD